MKALSLRMDLLLAGRRVPRGFLYSIASFGTSLGSFVISTYVGFYYISVVGLPPRWVGWGLFAFSWWNALNDPLVGWLSDRTRTRWGRRVPYVALLTVPLALSFAAIWSPPMRSADRIGLFAFMMALITLNDLLYSTVALNVTALLPEMFPDLAARARVNGWRQIMGLVGMLIGAASFPVLAQRYGWSAAGMFLGAALTVAFVLSLTGMYEHRVYAQARQPALWPALLGALRHRAFLVTLGIGFFGRFALTTLNATIPFYAAYALGLGSRGASWLLGSALGAALATMWPWARLLARWGARRTLMVAQLLTAIAVLPLLFVYNLVGAVAVCVLAGIAIAGLLITPDVMLSDVVDADHVRTGQRREGVYFGLANLVNRLPNVLQAALIGEMLTFAGFSVDLADQPAAVAAGLRVVVGVVPAVALSLALVLTWIYPLHGARLARVKMEVAALRAIAEATESTGEVSRVASE